MTTSHRDQVRAAVMSLARFIGDDETRQAYESQLRLFDARFSGRLALDQGSLDGDCARLTM